MAANGDTRNLSVFMVNRPAACSGVPTPAPTNSLGTTGNVAGSRLLRASRFYSLTEVNGGANQIYGYRINPSTGALSLLPGFPVATGGTGTTLAASEQIVHHNGRLYVLNDNSDTMSAFKVNRTTGALTALPFSPMAIPVGSQSCVAVHPSGSPVVVGNGGTVNSFNVGATTATLAPNPFFSSAAFSCRFSQDGNYFYAGGNFGVFINGIA